MGTAGSTLATVDVEAFKRAQEVYKRAEPGTTAASMLALIEDALMAAPAAPAENPSVRHERNVRFLMACGKYEKGSKGADLSRTVQLFEQGVDVDFADEDGWTALFHACGEGQIKVVKYLTDTCKVGLDVQSDDGTTALWTAAFNGQTECVHHLLLCGADERIKGQPEGEPSQSPALAARRNRKPGLADLLDAEGAMRVAHPERRERCIRREMDIDEYRSSMRAAAQQVQQV